MKDSDNSSAGMDFLPIHGIMISKKREMLDF